MELKQLVRINEDGLVADSVNFGMLEDETKNLTLCNGFVFNYAPESPKSSTVGVLECVRRSFFSPSEPNVHLVVQDYGKGKSHFALVIANFFRKKHNAPEVKGILHQVEVAVGGKQGILEDLKAHKERSRPCLVITVSGERQTDLKQMLLRQIRKALQADGVTDSIAQHLCEKPLSYLRSLSQNQRTEADRFLSENSGIYGPLDTSSLIKLLEGDAYKEIVTVVGISRRLTGFPIDFNADLSVEEILEDLLEKLCKGATSRYQGILILFDELNVYLQSWATNPASAGGMTLQNITNVCENNKGRIALVCFTQIKPSSVAALPSNSLEIRDYKKLTSRLELGPSTYEPMSSLELVLDNLVNAQHRAKWQEFMTTWRGSLQRDSEAAFERCTIYQQRRWPFAEFFQHVGQGTFPLHPLTTYLLCNLDFMQGRTAIQFVKENVKQYIATEVADRSGFLNYMRPVELIDAFRSNLSSHPLYPDYERAVTTIQASATGDDLTVLKALFLFYVSAGKLKKPDMEGHEQLLASLCGMAPNQAGECLRRLAEQLGVIYHFAGTFTYRFYSGVGLNDLRRVIDEEVSQAPRDMQDVASYVEENLTSFVKLSYVDGSQFVTEQRLVEDDWRFAIRVLTPDRVRELLDRQTLADNKDRGIVAFALPTTSNEAQELAVEFENSLKLSPVGLQVAVAVPKDGLVEVAGLILRVKALARKSAAEKERYGAAHGQLLRMWEQEIGKRLSAAMSDFVLCSSLGSRLPPAERNNWHAVVSVLLRDRYGFVPTLENIDKMRSGHKTGARIVAYMVKQLLNKTLSKQSFPDNSYRSIIDPLFLRGWGLLKLAGSQYSVQIPTNSRVKAAWDTITETIPLRADNEVRIQVNQLWRLLSAEPFGYSELTFTALFGAWVVFHRDELKVVVVRQPIGQPPQMQELTLSQFFSQADLETPAKFATVWQREGLFVTRRAATVDVTVTPRMSTDEAKNCVAKIQEFLSQDAPGQNRAIELKKASAFLAFQITQIEEWEQSWHELGRDVNSSELVPIVDGYSKLQKAPDFTGKSPEVFLSEGQKAEQVKVLEKLRGTIRNRINAYEQRAEILNSDQEFRVTAGQIERDLEVLKRVPSLFEAFSVKLSDALLAAERRMESLRDRAQYDDSIANIKSIMSALGPATNQSALVRALRSIDDLAKRSPDVKSSQEYREAVSRIEKYRLDQHRNLSDFKTRAEHVNSRRAAETLLGEISFARERFDSEADAAQIDHLCSLLASTAERFASIEAADEILKSYIATVRRLSDRVFSARETNDAISAYQEMLSANWSGADGSPSRERVETEAMEIRERARAHISKQIERTCSRIPATLEGCHRLRDELTFVLEQLTGSAELLDLKAKITSTLQNTDEISAAIEQRSEDNEKLTRMRRLKDGAPNTLFLCETAVAEIGELQKMLNFPDAHDIEIRGIVSSIERRQAEFGERLAEIASGLAAVKSYEEFKPLQRSYDQLAMVFTGSKREEDYRALEARIRDLQRIVERLNEYESRSLSAVTVRQCQDRIQELDQGSDVQTLPSWATDRLAGCRKRMEEIVRGAGGLLDKWEAQIAALNTVEEVENLRSAIDAKAPMYSESQFSDRYRQLTVDARALGGCLRLHAAITGLQTAFDCEKAMARAADWRSDHDGVVSTAIVERAQLVDQDIKEKLRTLKREEVERWKKWVAEIQGQAERVRAMGDSPGRSEGALDLLDAIVARQDAFSQDLVGPEIAILESVRKECTQIVNRDKETRILLLFRELPEDLQRSLCRRIAENLGIESTASQDIATTQRDN